MPFTDTKTMPGPKFLRMSPNTRCHNMAANLAETQILHKTKIMLITINGLLKSHPSMVSQKKVQSVPLLIITKYQQIVLYLFSMIVQILRVTVSTIPERVEKN